MNDRSAVVAWPSRKGRVMVSLRRDGGAWTHPVPVSGREHRPSELQVALDRRGDITVVWRETVVVFGFGHHVVKAVRRIAGERWTRPVRVSGPVRGTYDHGPQVTLDDSGTATVVWLREFDNSDGCPVMITHRTRAAAHWSNGVRLAATQGCGAPTLVTNGRGDSAAQWTGSQSEGSTPTLSLECIRRVVSGTFIACGPARRAETQALT
jgi:hypothetical protein